MGSIFVSCLKSPKFRSQLGRAALETPCEPHRRCAGMMRGRIRRHQGVVRAERPKAGLVLKKQSELFLVDVGSTCARMRD